MSLMHKVTGVDEVAYEDPGYISDAAMEGMFLAMLSEEMNPSEIEEFVSESSNWSGVFENQKNVVRLNKQAKLNRAYKTGILQCAAEDNTREYKKLRTLWKMEAALFRKLEKRYSSKAKSRAKVAVANLAKRKKDGPVASVANKTDKKLLGGTNKLLGGGVNKAKSKKK